MPTLYVDTNIFVYAVEDSKNKYGQDISFSSSKLFEEAISCKHTIVLSSWTLLDLSSIQRLEKLEMLFQLLQRKIIRVSHSDKDIFHSKKKKRSHFEDEMHILLAERTNAEYIVTRNVKDFMHSKIPAIRPEDLL